MDISERQETKSEVPEYSAPISGEPNSELMQTDHDDVKGIANTGPSLDEETLDSIGLNAELPQVFVKPFEGITVEEDAIIPADNTYIKWLKKLALERLARAIAVKERDDIIDDLSKSILVQRMQE
jgi:hypothetical protein